MNITQFDRYCKSLPASEFVIQWGGAHVWKVGGKVFALASQWGKDTTSQNESNDKHELYKIGFKASEMAFYLLTDQADIQPSPYLGRYKWVQLQNETALLEEDLKAYIAQSYQMIVLKLTKAKRLELGL